MKRIANLNQALEDIDIDSQLRDAIHELLGHISGVAREREGRAVDVATSRELVRIADDYPLVMVIPGEGNGLGACLPILLAVSDSKHRGPKSPKAVMQHAGSAGRMRPHRSGRDLSE